MCACVTLQIEGVVESFTTECAQITFAVTVTLHVTVEKALKGEHLGADPALELGRIGFRTYGREFLGDRFFRQID